MIVFIVGKGKTMIDSNYYYNYLTQMRARRTRSFINDRGFRHINTYCEVDDGFYSGIYPAILESTCKYPDNPLLKNVVILYGESSDFLNKIRKINSEEGT